MRILTEATKPCSILRVSCVYDSHDFCVIVKNKLTPVCFVSSLLFIVNFVITLTWWIHSNLNNFMLFINESTVPSLTGG